MVKFIFHLQPTQILSRIVNIPLIHTINSPLKLLKLVHGQTLTQKRKLYEKKSTTQEARGLQSARMEKEEVTRRVARRKTAPDNRPN